ncbi:glycine--tRNA ligase [soil metagenome]
MSSDTQELKPNVTLDTLVSLCKRRGFIFPGSEIYEGLAGAYDYGPLGALLKKNVKDAWWKSMIQQRDDIEGLDAAILMNPRVWKASGHVDTFSDPLSDSLGPSRKRYRADHVEEIEATAFEIYDVSDEAAQRKIENAQIWAPSKKKAKEFYQAYWEKHLSLQGKRVKIEEVAGSTKRGRFSPDDGGVLTEPRAFNLMLTTHLGPVVESAAQVYLRPETAQAMFVNFSNVQASMRRKLPFGIAQMGRSFRNEITPKNFIFRTREFEQMEMEFFCKPGELCKEGEMNDDQWYEHWVEYRTNWHVRYGIKREHLRFHYQSKDELAHYSKACCDIEFLFPIGWQELEGIANRANYDLKQHMEHSGKDLRYFDQELNSHYIPYVIEPALGVDRSCLAFITDAYTEEQVKEDKRVVLKLHTALAPIKAAVFPLLKNRPEIVEMARKLCKDLKTEFHAVYDDTGAIGKLYRRQDEIGTPFCMTVDVESLTDQAVTIRERDSMQQVRMSIGQVKDHLSAILKKDASA